MTSFPEIFLLLMSLGLVCGDQFCASDGQGDIPDWLPENFCNATIFPSVAQGGPPPIVNATSTGYIRHDCGIMVVLDLDQSYTNENQWAMIMMFLDKMVTTCMDRGVGYTSTFKNMFNDSVQPTVCCGDNVCGHQIGFMDYDRFVGNYDTHDTFQPESTSANLTYYLVKDMKTFTNEKMPCKYNTMVMITSRLFVVNPLLPNDIEQITGFGCVTFTIIAVGNPVITPQVLSDQYSELTDSLYSVPDHNCMPYLADCIRMCGPMDPKECQQQSMELTKCAPMTEPPPTSSPSTTTTPTTTVDHEYDDYWNLIYIFALSNRTTADEFQRAIIYIQNPLQDCIVGASKVTQNDDKNDNQKIVVRFLARNSSDSGWLADIDTIHGYMEDLQMEEILLSAADSYDVTDNVTLQLITWAVSLPIDEDKNQQKLPRLTLMTDFASENFIQAYSKDAALILNMERFDFNVYAFNNETAEIYRERTQIPKKNIHVDPNYADDPGSMIVLCQPNNTTKEKKNTTTLMFIIVGTCTGLMIILIVATILYRQKYMWMEKLNKFKNNQKLEAGDDDMIDYWEMSWDKIIVKNERLGHGAYGQVFKGKIFGTPPAIEQYARSEAKQYSDCDVAVKMLPPYATENSRIEFMHEIELMKTLGLHENIVNMLGCITSTAKSCLVLEYCSSKDLLRYLKLKKATLEISRSMDDQIECTKEFLNFAWQISQGMNFLVARNIIHRDLAARNVLITGYDGMKTAKIGDFGLAMSAIPSEQNLSASGRLPIKWLALESLQKEIFSFKSDIWSFGIVLFEMYSMGEIPFSDVEPTDLIEHLKAGNRPKRPLLAPDKISEIMTRCWDKEPNKRPTFEELIPSFTTLLEQAAEGYGYLALIKSSENYRVLSNLSQQASQVNDESSHFYADEPQASTSHFYSDEPCRQRTCSKTSKHSRISRKSGGVMPESPPRLPYVRSRSRMRSVTMIESFDKDEGLPGISYDTSRFSEEEEDCNASSTESTAEGGETEKNSPEVPSEEESSAERVARWKERLRKPKSHFGNPFKKIRKLAERTRSESM